MLNKMMQLKHVTNGHVTNGHVTKYLVSVDGGLGAEPPAAGQFLRFCSNKIAILTPF